MGSEFEKAIKDEFFPDDDEEMNGQGMVYRDADGNPIHGPIPGLINPSTLEEKSGITFGPTKSVTSEIMPKSAHPIDMIIGGDKKDA